MTDDVIGVRLVGGPPHLDGWANAYDAEQLGGWPPPEELAAFAIGGVVAVALPERVPDDFKADISIYRKAMQSVADTPAPGSNFFRGATYEFVPTDD